MEVAASPLGVLSSPSSFSSPPLKPRLLTFSNSWWWTHLLPRQHHLNLRHMDRVITPSAASPTGSGLRVGEVKRETKETNVLVKINLDGTGVTDSNTGIPFLDHMLDDFGEDTEGLHVVQEYVKSH